MQTISLWVYQQFVMPDDNSLKEILRDRPAFSSGFTNGPDYAREAMWVVFSQRPDILSFYYAGRLYPNKMMSPPWSHLLKLSTPSARYATL